MGEDATPIEVALGWPVDLNRGFVERNATIARCREGLLHCWEHRRSLTSRRPRPRSAGGGSFTVSEILDAWRSGKTCRGRREFLIRWFLESVLDQQAQVIPLVEDLAFDFGMHLLEPPHLPILLGHQLLAHGRDLDVEVIVGKVEVGAEVLRGCSVIGELDGKLAWFVLPGDLVEIEQSRKLSFALVCEIDLVCRLRLFEELTTQLACASVTSSGTAVGSSGYKR